MNKKSALLYFILTLILFLGLWFRLKGISTNHSFWSDEAFVSSFSQDIITGKTSWIKGASMVGYQPLQIVVTAFSFMIFGISEFSARLPTVLFGVIGIFFAFLVAKKLSNWSGGLLAAFLMAFSQLNLSHATQAKPYVVLQTLFLVQIYLLIKLIDKKKLSALVMLFITTCIVYFFHSLAVLFWISFGITLIVTYFLNLKKLIQKPLIVLGILLSIVLVMYFFGIFKELIILFKPLNGRFLFAYSNTVFLKNIFLRQYGIFLIPAVLSFLMIDKKYRGLIAGIICYIFVLLFMWNFRSYSHNMRYLMTFFGFIFVFFGVFLGKITDLLYLKFQSASWRTNLKLIPILVLITIYISSYKIVCTPQNYYSPNLDLYGDVQNADYKTMFAWIEKKYGNDINKIAIFDDLIDSERFYLNRSSNAYFMKGAIKPYPHPINKIMILCSLDDFLKQKARYQSGILIIEDWESFLPEDIKQYAKKNLRLEYRVEKMTVGGERDIWPLEVRSWGMN